MARSIEQEVTWSGSFINKETKGPRSDLHWGANPLQSWGEGGLNLGLLSPFICPQGFFLMLLLTQLAFPALVFLQVAKH